MPVSVEIKGCAEGDWREQKLNAIFLLIPRYGGVTKGHLNLDKLEQARGSSHIQQRLMWEISFSVTFHLPAPVLSVVAAKDCSQCANAALHLQPHGTVFLWNSFK